MLRIARNCSEQRQQCLQGGGGAATSWCCAGVCDNNGAALAVGRRGYQVGNPSRHSAGDQPCVAIGRREGGRPGNGALPRRAPLRPRLTRSLHRVVFMQLHEACFTVPVLVRRRVHGVQKIMQICAPRSPISVAPLRGEGIGDETPMLRSGEGCLARRPGCKARLPACWPDASRKPRAINWAATVSPSRAAGIGLGGALIAAPLRDSSRDPESMHELRKSRRECISQTSGGRRGPYRP